MALNLSGTSGIVGAGIGTIGPSGANITGVVTATAFVGSGADLTGVASTENIRTNTNATFLQNVNVSGTVTATSAKFTDDGSASPIVSIQADDANPYSLSIGNQSYNADTAYGLHFYNNNSGEGYFRHVGNSSYLDYHFSLHNGSTNKLCLKFEADDQSVELYNSGSKKFETTETGTVTTGISTAAAFIPDKGQLSNRNIIINGAMSVAQRGTSNTNDQQGYKTVDRFTVTWSGLDSVIEQHQGTLSTSDGTPYNLGFRNTWKLVNGDQTGGAGASDYIQAEYRIEAQDLASSGWHYKSASSYITLSFWLKTSVSQNFTINFTTFDGTGQRIPMKTGTIAANTWTKITKTVPGNSNIDINNDTGKGMSIMFYPYLGNSYVGGSTLNVWSNSAVSNFGGSNESSWYTTNDATFEVTGFQLEVGEHATPFEHLRYGDDLANCQRYYWRTLADNNIFFPGLGMADVDGNTVILNTQFPVQMRSAPTAVEQSGTASDYKIRRSTTQTCSSVPTFGNATVDQVSTAFTKSSHGWGDGSSVRAMGGASGAFLGWSCEL